MTERAGSRPDLARLLVWGAAPGLSMVIAIGVVTSLGGTVVVVLWLLASWLIVLDARRLGMPQANRTVIGFVLLSMAAGVLFNSGVLTSSGSDAGRYYDVGSLMADGARSFTPLRELWGRPSGTLFVENATGRWISLTRASRVATTGLFVLIGTVGHWLLATVVIGRGRPTRDRSLIWLLILLAPTLLYWRSEIGKDALVFLAVGVCLRCTMRSRLPVAVRVAGVTAGLALCFLVRPQIAVVLLAGGGLGLVWSAGRSRRHDLGFITGGLALAVVIALSYASLGLVAQYAAKDAEVTSLSDAFDQASAQEGIGGTGYRPVVISGPSNVVPGSVSVMLAPLTQSPGAISAVATIEMLAAVVLLWRSWRWAKFVSAGVVTMLSLSVLMLIALSSSYNVGLLLRQRALLLAFLLIAAGLLAPKRRAEVEIVEKVHH